MKRFVWIYIIALAGMAMGCAPNPSGMDWENIDYAGIHCENASPDNRICHPRDDDPAIIGARSGKSK
ncbi:MAG: hypothetical protein ACK502_01810 [Alphaproteobacteria bacterium]